MCHIAAGVRLADPQRGDLVSGERGFEKLLLLLGGTDFTDDGRGHFALNQHGHVDAGAARLHQLFGEHHDVPVVEALPPGVDGVAHAVEAHVAELLEELPAERCPRRPTPPRAG